MLARSAASASSPMKSASASNTRSPSHVTDRLKCGLSQVKVSASCKKSRLASSRFDLGELWPQDRQPRPDIYQRGPLDHRRASGGSDRWRRRCDARRRGFRSPRSRNLRRRARRAWRRWSAAHCPARHGWATRKRLCSTCGWNSRSASRPSRRNATAAVMDDDLTWFVLDIDVDLDRRDGRPLRLRRARCRQAP